MVDSAKISKLFGTTPQGAAGQLLKESQFVWRYDMVDSRCALSLTMPIRAETYNNNQIHPIFAMNLPEGEQFYRLQKRFAKQFVKFDEMAILSIVGGDQIGRVRLAELSDVKKSKPATVGLAELKKSHANDGLFEYLVDQYYDSGISGAQPKVLIPDADVPVEKTTVFNSDLIIKTGGIEYPHLSQNEYLCMTAAKRANIDVPEFHLSNDGSLFMMRRFDLTADGARLGFEDFAVLSGRKYDSRGHYKYEVNYEGVCSLIGRICAHDAHIACQKFFEYLVFSCMVKNGDAHLKNFGLIYSDPSDHSSIRLAPMFDVVTTSVYEFEDTRTGRMLTDRELALKLNKSRSYPTRAEMIHFGRSVCFEDHPEAVFDRVAQAMTDVAKEHWDMLAQDFGERMLKQWTQGMFAFEPDRVFK